MMYFHKLAALSMVAGLTFSGAALADDLLQDRDASASTMKLVTVAGDPIIVRNAIAPIPSRTHK